MKILKIIIPLIPALFYYPSLKAQGGYPSSINVNGGSKTIIGITYDWNFGELLMVNTIYSEQNLIITTGFLQNDFGLGVNFVLLENTSPFKIGPNPVIHKLKIQSDQNGIVISNIEVRNDRGIIIKIIQGPFTGIHFNHEVSFVSVNTGIYYVVIYYVVGNLFSKMKILKIIKT